MRTHYRGVLATALACVALAGAGAEAQTVISAPSDTYPTIQAAISVAGDGDTVQVVRGTYTEALTLKTGVTVQGAETAATILNGTVTGTGGTLERVTVKEQAWSFGADADGVVIRNCVFMDAIGTALEFIDATNTTVTNNTFYKNETALAFINSSTAASSGTVLANLFVSNDKALQAPMAPVVVSYNLFANNTDSGNTGENEVPAADSFADDGFVDAAGEDFHLVAGSDCIDAVPADILADPDDSRADCGAYGGPDQDPNPGQMTGLKATAGTAANSADLTWTTDANYLVTGYSLHYGTVTGVYDSTVPITGRDTGSATVSNLTTSSTPPPAPVGLTASPGDRAVFLSWDPSTGAAGYTVLYGTQAGTYTAEYDAGSSTDLTLGGLTNGVHYYLAVRPYAASTYYFAVRATGTPPADTGVAPEGRLSDEQTLSINRTEGDLSAEVSETPESISGYPGLEDSGFCFLRAVLPFSGHRQNRLVAGLLGALLLAGVFASAQRWDRRRLLPVLLCLALVAAAGVARAAPPNWSLDAHAGAFWPSDGDWDQHYDRDILPEVKLGVGYRLTSLLEFGVEAGYRRAEGTVRTTDSGRPLAQPLDQTLTVVPLQVYTLVRMQSSEDQLLVPYLAAGLSSTLYRHEVDGGSSARGRREGYHARGGLRLSLRPLDPRAADRSRQQYGLLGSALTLEAQYARVDDFGGAATDLGGWSMSAGLNLQF